MVWRVGAEDRGIASPLFWGMYTDQCIYNNPIFRFEYAVHATSGPARVERRLPLAEDSNDVRETHIPIRDGPTGAGAAAQTDRVQGRLVRSMADYSHRSFDRGRHRRPQLSRALFEACGALYSACDLRSCRRAQGPGGPADRGFPERAQGTESDRLRRRVDDCRIGTRHGG